MAVEKEQVTLRALGVSLNGILPDKYKLELEGGINLKAINVAIAKVGKDIPKNLHYPATSLAQATDIVNYLVANKVSVTEENKEV